MKYFYNFKSFVSTYVIYFIVIFGAFFFVFGKYMMQKSEIDWGELTYDLGKVLLSGGAFAAIVKSEQFSKIFHNELRGIVYSEEHLTVRSDLETIWEKVTKSLSKQKFSVISSKMQENIKKYYLPIDHDYYYNDPKIKIDIDIDAENPDYVVLKEKYTSTIICEDDKLDICIKFKNGIPFEKGKKELTTYNLESFKLNGKAQNFENNLKIEYTKDHLVIDFEMNISGSKKYALVREETKTYNLKLNSHRRQLAVWLYNNCYLDLHYPKEIEVELHDLGVLGSWTVDKTNNKYNRIEAEYKGLIYKNQGYMLYLCKS